MTPLRIVLLLSILSGCRLDFVEITPESRAHLGVQISVSDRADRLRIEAGLKPGTDQEGRPRGVSSSLVVLGLPIAPSRDANADVYIYHASWPLSSVLDPNSPVTVQVPEIGGISNPEDPVYELNLPRRVGPAEVERAEGEQVLLKLSSSSSAVEHSTWSLEIFSSTGRLRIQSDGIPPTEIPIPPVWLASSGLSPLEIRMTVLQVIRMDHVEGTYSLDFRIASELDWTVSAVAPAQ